MLSVLLMTGLAQVGGWGSYRGHLSCHRQSELDFAGRTGTTAEAAVGEGPRVQTLTPPTKTDRKIGAAVRTDAKEVGWRKRDGGLMGMGTSVRPAVRRPHEKVGPAIWSP